MHQVVPRLELALMSDQTGHRLRERRVRMGLSVRQLAEEAVVDRGRLAKLEADDPTVGEIVRSKVDGALTRLEQEMGMDDPEPLVVADDVVEFRVSGNFGVDVVVKGPVRDLRALEQSVNRILSQMQEQGREVPPKP